MQKFLIDQSQRKDLECHIVFPKNGAKNSGEWLFDWSRTQNAPMMHMIDQHAYAGIAHLWPAWPSWMDPTGSAVTEMRGGERTDNDAADADGVDGSANASDASNATDLMQRDTFLRRFRFIFDHVTGWNPRNRFFSLPEPTREEMAMWRRQDDYHINYQMAQPSNERVKHQLRVIFVRSAQKAILASLRYRPAIKNVIGMDWHNVEEVKFPIDHGVLAGGVGVIGDRKEFTTKDHMGVDVKSYKITQYFTVSIRLSSDADPSHTEYIVEDPSEFVKMGLPPNATHHTYQLSVSIGMDSPDPVVLDYIPDTDRGEKRKLVYITNKALSLIHI